MTKKDFLLRLDELLEQPAGTLSGAEELEALGWDSLKALEFLALVDETFEGYELPPEELVEAKTINDLVALLGDRVA
jgi:acyl carrier protein